MEMLQKVADRELDQITIELDDLDNVTRSGAAFLRSGDANCRYSMRKVSMMT